MEIYSNRTDEKWCLPMRAITNSVGLQVQGINSTIEKKEEGDDRYKQIDERIAIMEKTFSVMNEKSEIRIDEPSKAHNGKAIATGFHGDTSETEVEQLLRETLTEIGMSIENARIECPAKSITHAFIYF